MQLQIQTTQDHRDTDREQRLESIGITHYSPKQIGGFRMNEENKTTEGYRKRVNWRLPQNERIQLKQMEGFRLG